MNVHPLLFALLQLAFLNCLGYMLYGCLIKDPFLMSSVALGLPANYFAVSSALSILGKTGKGSNNETTWKLEYIVLIGLMVWICVGFTCGAVLPAVVPEGAVPIAVAIVGYTCIVTCLLYYFAPLTAALEIIKNKDAAGLHLPMVVSNLITSTVWAAYGFIFIGDPVVFGPNMFAVALSCCQMYLKCAYPSVDPTKLQRRMTKDTKDFTISGESESDEEEMKEAPAEHRPRAFTQDVLCGDGTVQVIEFTEEEAATRQRRSSTAAEIAEKVLDAIDILGPRRLPLEHVEVGGLTAASFDAADRAADGTVRAGGGVGGARSPMHRHGGRGVSILDPETGILLSPSRRMRIDTGSNNPFSSPRGSTASGGRRRALSDPRALPVIAEDEGATEEPTPSSVDQQTIDFRGTTATRPRTPSRRPPPPYFPPHVGSQSERDRDSERAHQALPRSPSANAATQYEPEDNK